jgi:hypothetical protein
MSSRIRELEAKRKLLVAQGAVQRETLRLDAAVIGDALLTVDRAVAVAQRLRRSPWVISAAVVGLFIFRRHPLSAWVLRGVALAGTARRIGGTLRRLADEASADDPQGR